MIKPLSKVQLSKTRLSAQKDNQEIDTEIFNIDNMIPLSVSDLRGNLMPQLKVQYNLKP